MLSPRHLLRVVTVAGLCLLPCHRPASAAPANPDDAFAIVSPVTVKRLRAEAGSLEGGSIIARAKAALTRPPGPIPVIHTEGTIAHQGIWDESLRAEEDLPVMLNFALAHAMTGDRAFLDAADRYLDAWLSTYKVSFNPIDETAFDAWWLTYDVVRAELPAGTHQKMDALLRGLAEGYLGRIDEQVAKGKLEKHNWQSHRLKLITFAAFSLGDADLIARAHAAYTRHVALNILPGGEVGDFALRDALHYVVYDLEPLVEAAIAAKAHGQDWYQEKSTAGTSVAMAMDWLTPYALGERTHEEFVHSKVGFDAERAKAGMKGYSGMWEPISSVNLYQYATALDRKYQPVFEAVNKDRTKKRLEWFAVLLRAGLRDE